MGDPDQYEKPPWWHTAYDHYRMMAKKARQEEAKRKEQEVKPVTEERGADHDKIGLR